MNMFVVRAAELIEDRPELAAAVEPLLKAREAVEKQIADLDRKVMRLARNDVQVRRFMTAPQHPRAVQTEAKATAPMMRITFLLWVICRLPGC